MIWMISTKSARLKFNETMPPAGAGAGGENRRCPPDGALASGEGAPPDGDGVVSESAGAGEGAAD